MTHTLLFCIAFGLFQIALYPLDDVGCRGTWGIQRDDVAFFVKHHEAWNTGDAILLAEHTVELTLDDILALLLSMQRLWTAT